MQNDFKNQNEINSNHEKSIVNIRNKIKILKL